MDWRQAYLRAAGAPLTAANVKFLSTWQPFEGGATHNDATFNYFNSTFGKQYPPINSVGVRAYPSLEAGAAAFAETLAGNRNYNGLLQGLRTGDPFKMGSRTAAALSTWLTGSPNSAKGLAYAQKVLGGQADATPQPSAPVASPAAPTSQSQAPDLSAVAFQNLGSRLRPTEQLSNLVAAVAAGVSPSVSPAPAAASTPVSPSIRHPASAFRAGDPIPTNYLSSVGGEHPTEGLPGYPARDYFAKAGSPVVAPVGGTVVRLSGHDPKQGPTEGPHGPFGWSVYIKGSDGRTYYLTHLGSRSVKAGDKVAAGAQIGTVGNYAKYGTPSHVHQGVNG